MRTRRDLSVEHLVRSAHAVAGGAWSCPADDIRLEGLRRLVDDIRSGAPRDAAAMQALRLNLSRLIAASIAADMGGDSPSSRASGQEDGPIFVTGFGRTGSTFVHNLLALDPRAHAPRLWELWYPAPPPTPQSYVDDERIALTQSMLDHFDSVSPMLQRIHPMDPQAPDECNHLMLHTTHLAMMYDAPGYWEWLRQLDDRALRSLLSHYKTQVGYLQRHFAGRRWVSKSLAHLHFMPVLFDVFPNAKIVRLHRDPCDLIPSLCSLYANLRKLFQTTVDPVSVGAMVSDVFFDGMDRMMRSANGISNCIDIHFNEMTADPIGTVSDIYARFGYEYGLDHERAMKDYIASRPRAMKSSHSYSLEEFGVTRTGLTERSEAYLCWLHQRTEPH
jgi:hypothetical protein